MFVEKSRTIQERHTLRPFIQAIDMKLHFQENVWLAESGWEEDVRWEEDDSHSPLSVHLDMNDPNLIFQLLQTSHGTEEVDKAAALVIPPQPKASCLLFLD